MSRIVVRLLVKLRLLSVALIVSMASAEAFAQRQASQSLERQVVACFERNEYQAALDLIEDHLRSSPNDFNMLYNAACARSLLGQVDEAASTLLKAVKAGFRDFEHMRGDPDLRPLHRHPTYQAILEAAERVNATAGMSAIERWRVEYPSPDYRYETDEKRRLNYATALDADAHQRMRQMIERQADHLIATLFGKPPGYAVLIAVPTPQDADKFFNGEDHIGGLYDHGQKRLVSRNIGGSLRHEFFHVMHFGHMEQLNQQHPLWMQEGLACLYEDYDLNEAGDIQFLPNDRQLIVKRRAKSGILVKWKDLFGLSAKQFMNRAQELYPQVRSIFEFVAAEGNLVQWYNAYTKNFEDDRTGKRAFEIAFGKPLADVEKDWRMWVTQQPEVDISIGYGDASLGIRAGEQTSNDGVLIAEVLPRSAASRAGIRRNDVIVAIDNQDVSSGSELRKLIASRRVGDVVDVRIRRNGEYLTFSLTLQPLRGGM